MTIRRFDIARLTPLLADGFTLLAPNNRTVDAIIREYANIVRGSSSGIHSWERPAVFAIDIYIQQLWQEAASQAIAPFNETQLLGRFDEEEIWLQIVKSSYEKFPLLNSAETANSVARSYRSFQQWDVGNNFDPQHYRNAIDFQTFLSWSEQFKIRCDTLNAVSLSDAGRILAEHIEQLDAVLPQKIALINFNEPPPLYVHLFDALKNVREVNWDRKERQEQTLSTVFNGRCNTLRNYQSTLAEIDACIEWCLTKSTENPDAHIGIVVDHNHSLEPMIEEALFKTSQFNTSDQFEIADHLNRYHSNDRLSETPAFRTALALLSLNNELVDSEQFCKLLQSETLIGARSELQARIALELRLRGKTEALVRLSQLRSTMRQDNRDYYCPILAEALLVFTEIARPEPRHQSLRKWLQVFSEQLQALGWPGDSSTETGQSQVKLWQQICQRFAASSSVLGNISLGVALGKLQTFLKQSNVNLNFDDRRQISMLDIEEAQDLLFDYVWVLSVDHRNWPLAINPVAFIPNGLQLELSMPDSSTQQQLDTALTQLITLRNNTQSEIVMSYHSLEEELSIRPSALLKEISFETLDEDGDCADAQRHEQVPNKLERHQESQHIPLGSDEVVTGGTNLLSNQSNCPFRAFARNRLKAKGLEDFSHGLNPLARGNALHRALERLSTKLGDSKTLHALSSAQMANLLQQSTDIAIEYLRTVYPETMSPAFSQLERNRLTGLLEGFLLLEKQRDEFTILHNEKSVTWQHSQLSLELRIDRIDQLADGTLALIDYKTGKFTNYDWISDRPDDLQLPLYQLAVENAGDQSVGATLIFQLNAENIGVVTPIDVDSFGAPMKISAKGKKFEGGWPVLQDYWNKSIRTLADEFEAGVVAVAPTRGSLSCQYCDLGPLCRIAESGEFHSTLSDDEI